MGRPASLHQIPIAKSRKPLITKENSMRVKTISVEFGMTKNLGNFESARVSAQVWAEISEEEDEDGAMQYLFGAVRQAVSDNIPAQQNQGVTVNSQRTFKGSGGLSQ
jgi:hypothetical protein